MVERRPERRQGPSQCLRWRSWTDGVLYCAAHGGVDADASDIAGGEPGFRESHRGEMYARIGPLPGLRPGNGVIRQGMSALRRP